MEAKIYDPYQRCLNFQWHTWPQEFTCLPCMGSQKLYLVEEIEGNIPKKPTQRAVKLVVR